MKRNITLINYIKLIAAALIVGLLASLLASSLKEITGHYQELIFIEASHFPISFIILPSVGITLIYFLRKYLFKGKQNKGIKEIYSSLQERKNSLPAFKIPSHYFNGFLTVIFGGSTGIEVSTVVATATVGSIAHSKKSIANIYKTELVCAGVTAGIAILFGNPIAGFAFAIEVIAKKVNSTVVMSSFCAALVSWGFLYFIKGEPLFAFTVSNWHIHAIPYFMLLSFACSLLAVYFTHSVIFIKAQFAKITNNFIRVNLGAIIVGLLILYFPQLYGDSYHAFPHLINQSINQNFTLGFVLLLGAVILLKPLAASLTLGAGGDGGVFAPSIVAGALLGMMVAILCNYYFDAHLIVINFALVGAAAVLSAAIHAPITAVFLICGIAPGGYVLFIPILMGSFISRYLAQLFCNYTVYSYNGK